MYFPLLLIGLKLNSYWLLKNRKIPNVMYFMIRRQWTLVEQDNEAPRRLLVNNCPSAHYLAHTEFGDKGGCSLSCRHKSKSPTRCSRTLTLIHTLAYTSCNYSLFFLIWERRVRRDFVANEGRRTKTWYGLMSRCFVWTRVGVRVSIHNYMNL
jgi:hypothetical protein